MGAELTTTLWAVDEAWVESLMRAKDVSRHAVPLPRRLRIAVLRVARSVRVNARSLEAAVRVLAVVEGHAVDTQHVGLQVALLRGAVRAVLALEWPLTPMTCGTRRNIILSVR